MKLVRVLTAFALTAAVAVCIVAPAQARSSASGHAHPRSIGGRYAASSAAQSSADTSSADTSIAVTAPRQLIHQAPVATGRVIVRTKAAATSASLSYIARRVGVSAAGARDIRNDRFVWLTPKGKTDAQFARQLMATGRFVYAAPDHIRQVASYIPPGYVSPDDPYFGNNWAFASSSLDSMTGKYFPELYQYGTWWWLRDVNAPQAWTEGYTGSPIVGRYPLRASGDDFTVAVIDTGLWSSHADASANISGAYDYFDHENDNNELVGDPDVTPYTTPNESDENREIAAHGTCVAGEIGATANNGLGTVGVGYDTKVIVYKVMGVFNAAHGGGVGISDFAVEQAIRDAVSRHVKVINMSLGGYGTDAESNGYDPLLDAINTARAAGIVVVAAKGNDSSGTKYYPADYPGVVSVGALDKNVNGTTVPATFTNYAKTSLDIMAPGAYVWGLYQPDYFNTEFADTPHLDYDYNIWDGTSMASPLVAGAIAWLWRAAPSLSASEITNVVMNSATRHGATTHFASGYRELDMYAAYKLLEAEYPLLTKPGIANATVASLGSTTLNWATTQSPVRGVTYDVSIDGSPVQTGSSVSRGSFAMSTGSHAVHAAAHSNYNWDDGTAVSDVTITVTAPASGAASWSTAHVAGTSAVSSLPAYHAAVTVEGALLDASSTPLTGASVKLQSSTGVSWTDVATAVSEASPGVYRATISAPDSRASYRLSFAGSGAVLGATSSAVVVTPHWYVSTPSSKSSVSHTVKFTVSGTVKPSRSGSRAVQLQIYRYTSSKWSLYSRAWTTVTRHSGYSTYSVKVRVKKGSYRLYAYAPGDGVHSSTTSGYKPVAVK